VFVAWAALLVAAAGVIFFAMYARMTSLIRDSEVDKLRPAARELREVCADYLLSPSDRLLKAKLAKIMREFPDLAYVFFADRHGEIHSQGAGNRMDSLTKRLSEVDPARDDVNAIPVGRETYIDIADVTQTLPPLPVHVGFAKSLTDRRTRSVLWNRAAIALVVLAGGLAAGYFFLNWVTRPLLDLCKQAENLSLGDVSVSLDLKCRGEIGKVYRSLERLKESVLYALRRLDNNERPAQLTARQPQEEDMRAQGESRWHNPR
jgi:methyl-accepting chemotaxis protein